MALVRVKIGHFDDRENQSLIALKDLLGDRQHNRQLVANQEAEPLNRKCRLTFHQQPERVNEDRQKNTRPGDDYAIEK